MKRAPDEIRPDLAGRDLLIGVCGGIAAYKVCEVVSRLVQRGCGVTVAMSRAARKFVGPTTFQALTGRAVLTSLWHGGPTSDQGRASGAADIQHISLTTTAGLVLVAPATANIIGKMACGIADDVVSTLVISAACPTLIAPAMNDRMWANAIVQRNAALLREHGYHFVGPGEGWLACRSAGPGRMAEPDEIIDAVVPLLSGKRTA